jgi:hypothetical protein
MIDISNLTLKQINEINNLQKNLNKPHPYKINQNYFIRTVTYFFTGKLIEVLEYEIVLEEAAWIPDTGRYSDSFKTGEHSEVEPVEGRLIIGRQSIIDCTEWQKSLPRNQL